MKRKSLSGEHLTVSKEMVYTLIDAQLVKGRELCVRRIQTSLECDATREEFDKWERYNGQLLRQVCSDRTLATEYLEQTTKPRQLVSNLAEDVRVYRESCEEKILRLESIRERIELYAEQETDSVSTDESNAVFIVHGRDEAAKEAMARFIESLGLRAIILHEQPHKGMSLLDKFERNAFAGFAVVLLTPDDMGALQEDAAAPRPRARQNVWFELGYFIGRLGRDRVCTIVKGDVEIASDYYGVGYIKMTDDDGWRRLVARELRAAGIAFDAERIL